jgi:hypothetical protein
MSIILRSIKGAPLTYGELDGNFVYLSQSYAFLDGPNTFNGTQTIVGNLNVFGSASFSFVTSSTTEISSSIFGVTISTPSVRYGLYNVYDVGSTKTTASLAWDSTNSYWLYQKATGSVTSSAVLLTGPVGAGGLGSEVKLSQYRIPVSNGDQSLIDSYIYSNGANTTITGALAVSNVVSIGNVINSSPQYGKFLIISGSYPGVVLGHSNVGKAYSFGVGDFSQFFINDDNSSTTRLVIESNGWFGLGKSATAFLDVNGNTVISGSLIVRNGITATASYASNANALDGLNSTDFVTISGDQIISSNKSISNLYKLSFVGPLDGVVSIKGGSIDDLSITDDLLFLDNSGNTLAGLYQDGTGFKLISGSFLGNLIGTASLASTASLARTATTASYVLNAISSSFATTASFALNAVSSSFATTASFALNAISSSLATTASFLRPLSQSVSLTGSLITRNTATTTTFAAIGRSGSLYIDLSGVGLNYIDGNALFIRNSAGTTNLVTVSGSKFMVSAPTELSGSLSMRRADGDVALFVSSSVSSSSSTSVVGTTASFDSTIGFTPGGSNITVWDTDLDIYYSGNSGSGHTNLSPVSNQVADNAAYSTFTIVLNDGAGTGISLTPGGSIPDNKYTIWIYASGSINKWFERTDNDISTLKSPGLTININGGNTNTQLESDLLSSGFAEVSDPNPYTNNINTTLTITSTFTSSLINVKANTTITGSFNVSGSTSFVGTHTLSGSNTIVGNTVLSGSQILSGSNTIIGNTVMSGSITVSGSTRFANSIFIVTGSQFYTGSSDFKGNQTITGSLSLVSNGIGTGLFINGQKQFNYISLFHTASILPTQNVSGSFIYSSQITSSGISVVSGSRITFANTGTYNIQFSAQMYTPTNNTNVYIWFKKNGTNIANSATQIDIGTSDYGVAAWNFVDTFTSGSYAEIVYQTDQNNVQFQYSASSGNIPAIPSIIATVTQVA